MMSLAFLSRTNRAIRSARRFASAFSAGESGCSPAGLRTGRFRGATAFLAADFFFLGAAFLRGFRVCAMAFGRRTLTQCYSARMANSREEQFRQLVADF